MKGKIYWGRATFLQTSKSVSQPTKGSKGLEVGKPLHGLVWIGLREKSAENSGCFILLPSNIGMSSQFSHEPILGNFKIGRYDFSWDDFDGGQDQA